MEILDRVTSRFLSEVAELLRSPQDGEAERERARVLEEQEGKQQGKKVTIRGVPS